jgi:hypothetical protein
MRYSTSHFCISFDDRSDLPTLRTRMVAMFGAERNLVAEARL